MASGSWGWGWGVGSSTASKTRETWPYNPKEEILPTSVVSKKQTLPEGLHRNRGPRKHLDFNLLRSEAEDLTELSPWTSDL